MAHEEIALEKIQDGELSIDNNGVIWRHFVINRNKFGEYIKYFDNPRKAGGLTASGYWHMEIKNDGKKHIVYNHRIAFLYFNGMDSFPYSSRPRKYSVVNHINGNKTDNRKSNLELVTSSEDKIHSIDVLGKVNSRIDKKIVIEIIDLLKKGLKNGKIANIYGINKQTVSGIRNNKIWKRISRPGYLGKPQKRGENIVKAKLTEKKVKEILQLLKLGNHSRRSLAARYNVTRSTIDDISTNRSWKYIPRDV